MEGSEWEGDGEIPEGAEAGLSEWDGEEEGEVEEGDEQDGSSILAEGDTEGPEESYPEPPEEAKLFVGNLPYDMDSEQLAKLFDKAGVVEISEVNNPSVVGLTVL